MSMFYQIKPKSYASFSADNISLSVCKFVSTDGSPASLVQHFHTTGSLTAAVH
ncbi:hypothetical protein DPMN_035920 [Dreissena polymorpha]|uniref:Uncharacterized protein n=1 Tax=Dreissena polymorpha TaxID=45954 RepID=A0A9D4RLG8_DREPO|nr:hypothetical protein DPMN_035920 [Dreissena polymorpha]